MTNSDFQSATQELFSSWLKTYEGTVGKLVEMPAVGPAREKAEKAAKGFSVFTHLYATWMDSAIDLQAVSIEAMRQTQAQAMTGSDGETNPDSYKDFYKIWIEAYSETFKEFLKSGHFASDMGKLMSDSTEALQFNREMLEDNYLKPMNMPTKTDVDAINKQLYALKKLVKETAKRTGGSPGRSEVDAIKKDLAAVKATLTKLAAQTKKTPKKK